MRSTKLIFQKFGKEFIYFYIATKRNLTRNYFSRVYNSPPFLVMTVMCAVCVILNKKPDWSSAKQLLAEAGFITRLVNFNPEQVTEKTYLKFKQFSKNPYFKPDLIGKVSKACESLCCWVLAVEKFHEVYRTVRPKEERVREANEALRIMREGLAKKQNMLAQVIWNICRHTETYLLSQYRPVQYITFLIHSCWFLL